jgi:hypothetical protein
MNNTFKLVKTFNNPLNAHIAKGLLESNGIEAFIFDENTIYTNPVITTAIDGVKLLVRTSDFEGANAILNRINDDDYSGSQNLICPSCGSTEILLKNRPNWWAFCVMLFSFASSPITGDRKEFACRNCYKSWSDFN